MVPLPPNTNRFKHFKDKQVHRGDSSQIDGLQWNSESNDIKSKNSSIIFYIYEYFDPHPEAILVYNVWRFKDWRLKNRGGVSIIHFVRQ